MIHHTAIKDFGSFIGKGTRVWAYSHISRNSTIGEDCTIGEGVYVGEDVKIGDRCRLQNGAQIFKGLEIGNDVFIGPNVVTTNDIFPQLPVGDWSNRYKKTIIKNGASIGANSTIICGVTIGEGSMVGAGSVVTKSIPDKELWYGNPAKFKRKL